MPKRENRDVFFVVSVGGPRILAKLAEKGKLRFGEIYGGGFESPATLTRRLRQLEKLRMIKRNVEIIPGESIVISYEITEKGRKTLDAYRTLEALISE